MQTAIITGASSGIGREFAIRLDERYNPDEIWIIARREERLSELASVLNAKTKIIPLDLSESESLEELREILDGENPDIKFLVNAAGFGKIGSVGSQTAADVEDMINVNIRALTAITHMCLPYMLPGGGIINMASISAYTPLPYLNIYSATKAFVLHFSEALAEELKEKNIRVTAVCPYWVASEFISVAKQTAESEAVDNFKFITYPYPIVSRAIYDNGCGKLLSLKGILPNMLKMLSIITPTKLQMAVWNKIRKIETIDISNFLYNQQSPELLR